MKKLLALSIFAVSGITASAADMECKVSTGQWNTNHCFYFDYSMNKNQKPAYFRLTNVTKTISDIIWKKATSSCSSSSSNCQINIRPYRTYEGEATVLYSDGTYETLSASASFETGF